MEENSGDIIIYQTEDGQTKIDVKFEDENVWLTQSMLAELFDTTKQNVSLHLKNIFEEGELDEKSVVKDFLTTAKDGKKYKKIQLFVNSEQLLLIGKVTLQKT